MIDSQAELGRLVKLCREHRDLTQEQLAGQLELSRTAVAHLEQGLRLPEPRALRRLCEHLGIPEVLWDGFIPRDSLYPMAVRCHCRTHYRTQSQSQTGGASEPEQQRARLVEAIATGQPWRDGDRVIADPYRAGTRRLRRTFPRLFLNRAFVPVPPPEPGPEPQDAPWPSTRLARAYAEEGTDCRVERLFERTRPLAPKSRAGTRRPTVAEHLTTLGFTRSDVPPGVVLVDVVVDRGTTLIACATRLAKQGWRGQVDALVVAYERQGDGDPGRDGRELLLGWDGKWDHPVREG